MLKVRMKNKYDSYKKKTGTYNIMLNESDRANQSRAEDLQIKTMIQKYGIMPFEYMNKTMEPLYLDMTNEELTINQRLKLKQQTDEYFEKMPAKIRDNYFHDKERFYQMLVNGDFNQLQKDGILTQEYVNNYNNNKQAKDNKIAQLNEQIKQMQKEITNLEGVKDVQTN